MHCFVVRNPATMSMWRRRAFSIPQQPRVVFSRVQQQPRVVFSRVQSGLAFRRTLPLLAVKGDEVPPVDDQKMPLLAVKGDEVPSVDDQKMMNDWSFIMTISAAVPIVAILNLVEIAWKFGLLILSVLKILMSSQSKFTIVKEVMPEIITWISVAVSTCNSTATLLKSHNALQMEEAMKTGEKIAVLERDIKLLEVKIGELQEKLKTEAP